MFLLLSDFAFNADDFILQLPDIVVQFLDRHGVEIAGLRFLCTGIQIVVSEHDFFLGFPIVLAVKSPQDYAHDPANATNDEGRAYPRIRCTGSP